MMSAIFPSTRLDKGADLNNIRVRLVLASLEPRNRPSVAIYYCQCRAHRKEGLRTNIGTREPWKYALCWPSRYLKITMSELDNNNSLV